MFPINYLINFPLIPSQRLFFLIIIQRILASQSTFSPSFQPQKQQFSLYSRHDIVDKTVKPAETFLSAQDLKNMPEREVDLRELGISVETDPTLGTRNRGDIAEPPPSLRPQFDANGLARNSIRQPYRRWPRNEIPYSLSSQYGAYSRSVIAKAMDEYHSKTCVRFVPRDLRRHRDYVYIHPDDGCYSLVGRTGGKQPLSLDSGCIQVGTVVHELMHAVGFFHEQSRHDRDQYIQILWSNVLRGADDQFEKYGFNSIDQLGEPYDYGSIMHYGAYAFSANGKRTIVPRRPGSHKMGQRIAFSETDLRKINKLYQCDILNSRNSQNTVSNSRPFAQEMPSLIIGGDEENECEDKNWRCIFWSLPIFKYCAKWETLRKEICPFSCGQCPKTKAEEEKPLNKRKEEINECKDESPVCNSLSLEHCPGLTGKLFCKRTCGTCEE